MTQFPDFVLFGALLVALSLLPFMAVLATSYTKLVIVLGLLRMAIGTQQTPPNMVVNGIAIVLSVYIMAPIGFKMQEAFQAQMPASGQAVSFQDVSRIVAEVKPHIRDFLSRNTEPRDKAFFLQASTKLWPQEYSSKATGDDLLILVPAFCISELTEAFKIGFVIYIVFVLVDLIVGTVLLSMGMMMISPTVVSLPFKLLLFVALDGWSRLIQGLVTTYAI